ncbi:MAG: TAXI family TRAP transporter solute-binding subunit [Chloroflexi bacterium]|nr:TAXI family TRAP transporter solute-binding subunit [Chloroflexota bacterium]
MRRLITALSTALLVIAACQAPRTATPATPTQAVATGAATAQPTPNFAGRPLNIVTGGTGGVYIVYGGGLANLLTNKLGVSATAQSTTASVANMELIRDKKTDLAFTLSDTAYDAVKGNAAFKDKPATGARALAVLYTNFTHIITKADSGISTVVDLRGKRVSVGSPASGTEVIANRVLEAASLTQADLQVQKLGIADSAAALKDGKIDAFFWSGGLPTSAVTDLANTPGISLRLIEHEGLTKRMADKYGAFYFTVTIPKEVYKTPADTKVSGVANLLVAGASMDEALVKAVLATMFDNKAELEKVHPEAKNLTLANAVEGSPIDYHPGAIAYYKDKGAWKK